MLSVASCLTLIRVRVPDRPGALGLVASRIGALKGDIVGIEVLDRDGGVAVDELAVVLPSAELIAAVRREIEEVDGVTTEAVHVVEALPEPRLDALRAATTLSRAASTDQLFDALATEVAHALRADWCGVVEGERVVAGTSGTPAIGTLEAAIHVQIIGELGDTLAIGREHPVRAGEQLLITAMCELATTLIAPKAP